MTDEDAIAAFIAARGGRDAIRVPPAYCAPTQARVSDAEAQRIIDRMDIDGTPAWRETIKAKIKAARARRRGKRKGPGAVLPGA